MKMLKWGAVIVSLVLMAPTGLGLWFELIINPIVSAEIRDNPGGGQAKESMLLTFEQRTLPVNYLQEGNTVYVGVDGDWWPVFEGGGIPVSMLIRGVNYKGHAVLADGDPSIVADVFSRLRPTTPDWLPSWLTAKLVVITVQAERRAPQSS